MKRTEKLGIALSGGGSRGVAHAGFLHALQEDGIKPDFLAGCSIGAIVGASFAAGLCAEEIREVMLKLRPSTLLKPTVKRGGLFAAETMTEILVRHLGDITFSQLKIPFCCVAVDLRTQETVIYSEGNLASAVTASACIPGVFTPVQRDGRLLCDGGVIERIPVRPLGDAGATKIVAGDVLKGQNYICEPINARKVLMQVIGIMDKYIVDRYREECEKQVDLWVTPALGDMNQYAFKHLPEAYEQGLQAGRAALPQIRALIE